MLFNSYDFVYVFLPAVVIVFFLLGRASRTWALRWVIAASLFFYGWWRPLNLLIILPSVLINFFLARWLQRFNQEEQAGAARFVLVLGITLNVAFLGYFKYSNFLVDSVNGSFGTHLVLARVILPLGISFITFQKIAFLIDVQAGRIESFTLQDYCLFVLFFPQLIAGPIVHYREMMPQFHRVSCRLDKDNVSVGLTLLAFGLFKKILIADKISLLVSPIYQQAAAGGRIGLFPAWVAAFGFTLQIYFDFSGYTDMALGVARLFGIRLPELQLASSSVEHHRLLAALAHDADPFFNGIHLQSVNALVDTPPRIQEQVGIGSAQQASRSVPRATAVSASVDHAGVWNLAWCRLHFHRLGCSPRPLPGDQPCLADFEAQDLA